MDSVCRWQIHPPIATESNWKRAHKPAEIRKIPPGTRNIRGSFNWNIPSNNGSFNWMIPYSIHVYMGNGWKCLEVGVQAWIVFFKLQLFGDRPCDPYDSSFILTQNPQILPGGWGTFKFNSVLKPPSIFVGGDKITHVCGYPKIKGSFKSQFSPLKSRNLKRNCKNTNLVIIKQVTPGDGCLPYII